LVASFHLLHVWVHHLLLAGSIMAALRYCELNFDCGMFCQSCFLAAYTLVQPCVYDELVKEYENTMFSLALCAVNAMVSS
jgi:hypothetical protein